MLFEGLGDIQDLGSTVPIKQTARKSVIGPVLPSLQQSVEVLTFQAAAQVAASLAASPSEPATPLQLKRRTKTTPNTRREEYEKKIAEEMGEVQGREERRKKFKNDKRPWTNTPKPPLPPKVKRRRKPGVKALQEIRKFQMTVENVIPRAAFQRVVREISQSLKRDVRWSAAALGAIQEAAEQMATSLF